jgi:enoyl-CoA hydratase/carnithine racemase
MIHPRRQAGRKVESMIEFKASNRVGEIVIERASAGNAFTGDMVRQLRDALERAAESTDILTLTGAGADFTVGRDRQEPKTGSPFDAFRNVSELNKAVAAYPGILITAIRGRAFGLGVGLVMRSNLAFAADDAQFALDEVKLGIPPMFIMEEILEHLPSKIALDIVLSSREFGADEALRMGLLSRVAPASQLDALVGAFVETLRERDRSVILACKRYLRAVGKMPADARSAFALVEQTQFALNRH